MGRQTVFDVKLEIAKAEWEDERIEKELQRWKEKEAELKTAAEKSRRLNFERQVERLKEMESRKEKWRETIERTPAIIPMPRGLKLTRKTPNLYIITTKEKWPVKIGVSFTLATRVKSLQTANWETLELFKEFECPGNSGYYFEGLVHRSLSVYAMNGEWFNLTAEEAELAIWEAFESKSEMFQTEITSL